MKTPCDTDCDPDQYVLDCAVMKIELTHWFLFTRDGQPRVAGKTALNAAEEKFIKATACRMVRCLARPVQPKVLGRKRRWFADVTRDVIAKGMGLAWLQTDKLPVGPERFDECEFVYIPVTCGQRAPCDGLCDGDSGPDVVQSPQPAAQRKA